MWAEMRNLHGRNLHRKEHQADDLWMNRLDGAGLSPAPSYLRSAHFLVDPC
jgi:hypothetical protein